MMMRSVAGTSIHRALIVTETAAGCQADPREAASDTEEAAPVPVTSLKRQEAEEIDRRYRAGYADRAKGDCELGDWAGELEDWAAQGVWPEE